VSPFQRFPAVPGLSFDTRVGRYLRSGSHSSSERDCLRGFIQDLRYGRANTGHSMTMTIWLFHVCNHVLELKLTGPGNGIVTDLNRDITSKASPPPT
jgi:hypothetical protein